MENLRGTPPIPMKFCFLSINLTKKLWQHILENLGCNGFGAWPIVWTKSHFNFSFLSRQKRTGPYKCGNLSINKWMNSKTPRFIGISLLAICHKNMQAFSTPSSEAFSLVILSLVTFNFMKVYCTHSLIPCWHQNASPKVFVKQNLKLPPITPSQCWDCVKE